MDEHVFESGVRGLDAIRRACSNPAQRCLQRRTVATGDVQGSAESCDLLDTGLDNDGDEFEEPVNVLELRNNWRAFVQEGGVGFDAGLELLVAVVKSDLTFEVSFAEVVFLKRDDGSRGWIGV